MQGQLESESVVASHTFPCQYLLSLALDQCSDKPASLLASGLSLSVAATQQKDQVQRLAWRKYLRRQKVNPIESNGEMKGGFVFWSPGRFCTHVDRNWFAHHEVGCLSWGGLLFAHFKFAPGTKWRPWHCHPVDMWFRTSGVKGKPHSFEIWFYNWLWFFYLGVCGHAY